MPRVKFDLIILLLISYIHVIFVPFTKVEESFSLQAIHDIIAFGIGPNGKVQFDHLTFSGAVPRSFVGPLLLAIISYPILFVFKLFNLIQNSAQAGLIVRLTLTTLHAVSVSLFANLVVRHRETKRFFSILYCIQFHPIFWAGRTTPNGLVLPFANFALSLIFADSKQHRTNHVGLFILTTCAVIARLEVLGLIIPIALMIASEGIRSSLKMIQTGILAGICAISISVPLDTYLWNRPFRIWNPLNPDSTEGFAWPELEAVLFNVIEGKSSEWGISPWHAYISQHVGKLISIPCIILIFAGIAISVHSRFTRKSKDQLKPLAVIVCHIGMMSCLGHKETRFITYLTPLLNLYAAKGANAIWQSARQTLLLQNFLRIFVCTLFGGTILMTIISLYASAGNYPGGEALKALHELLPNQNATVHIDVLPAMTGVSLFQSINLVQRPSLGAFGLTSLPNVLASNSNVWAYDKTEEIFASGTNNDANNLNPLILTFTHLLSDQQDCHLPSIFEPMVVNGKPSSFFEFSHISIKPSLFPLDFYWRESVWLCKQKGFIS